MRFLIPVLIPVALAAVIGPAEGASAMPTMTHSAAVHAYKNCTAVRQAYSGGIARAQATRNMIGSQSKPLEGRVLHSNAAYAAVKALDRDHDGIACEKA